MISELQTNDLPFRRMIDQAPDAVFVATSEGICTYTNSASAKMLGYSKAEIIGKSILDFIPQRDWSRLRHERAFLSLSAWRTGDWHLKRKDGSLIDVEVRAHLLSGGRWQAFVRNVTDAKASAKERENLLHRVEDEKAWLEAVFEHSPIGIIFAHTEDIDHPTPNRMAKELFSPLDWRKGRSAYAGIAYTPFGQALSNDELTSTRILQGETLRSEEQLIRFSNGMEIPVLISGGPILDSAGKIIGGVAFFQDLTKQKNLEEKLRENEEKAKADARMKQELVSIVSHDLKNPLGAIRVAIEILQSGSGENLLRLPPERIFDLVSMIDRSSTMALNLVKNILDVEKMQSGNFEIQKKPVSLENLFHSVEQVMLPFARKKGVTLEFESNPRFEVIGDFDRLLQVFFNLIGNAIKFTPPEGKIRIRSEKTEQGQLFSVSDTGCGIAKENLTQIFEQYWQARETRPLGSGLGLYISKNIVKAHQGRIWAESELGKGTTFYFTIEAGSDSDKE
ncbi:MAG: ATP-binding protein [Pseudobdellovibrionaceae bacterium]